MGGLEKNDERGSSVPGWVLMISDLQSERANQGEAMSVNFEEMKAFSTNFAYSGIFDMKLKREWN